ncbi:MAG: PIN domain-containing protein [Calditrichae bacterium]|nr:PIN domain-containing protein [Calditrichia bacterium]
MKVIVDTSVWSLALRRHHINENNAFVHELGELIKEVRVQLIGPIRQEILSGIPSDKQFEKLRKYLAAFPDLTLNTEVYEEAARCFNINRSQGVQGSNTDFLICAVAIIHEMPILTLDKDFELFQQHIPLELHQPRVS